MAQFGQTSNSRLITCERDIQTILMEVVKFYDCMIVEGNRTPERQNEHWSKGRKLKPGGNEKVRKDWVVVDSGKIVTYKDGYEKLSKHQKYPSPAVDVVPYPSMWKDRSKLIELRGVIKFVQAKLLAEGKITKLLDNGADLWDGFDLPHYQQKP